MKKLSIFVFVLSAFAAFSAELKIEIDSLESAKSKLLLTLNNDKRDYKICKKLDSGKQSFSVKVSNRYDNRIIEKVTLSTKSSALVKFDGITITLPNGNIWRFEGNMKLSYDPKHIKRSKAYMKITFFLHKIAVRGYYGRRKKNNRFLRNILAMRISQKYGDKIMCDIERNPDFKYKKEGGWHNVHINELYYKCKPFTGRTISYYARSNNVCQIMEYKNGKFYGEYLLYNTNKTISRRGVSEGSVRTEVYKYDGKRIINKPKKIVQPSKYGDYLNYDNVVL